jgi:hypothetical protein
MLLHLILGSVALMACMFIVACSWPSSASSVATTASG